MKNFTLLLCTLFVFSFSTAFAQQNSKEHVRCGTMEAIEAAKKSNPEFAAMLLKKEKEAEIAYHNYLAKGGKPGAAAIAKTSTLTGPVTIPVIVHVVHSTPNLVTEDQIDYLINRLNLDFSGLNPDSANASAFYNIRGHSLIRFTRARRDPSGNPTTGIEKRVGTVLIGTNTYQPIKHASDGGLDPWDITKYYNIWVGAASGGLLGIAPAIGVGNATETTASSTGIDGVCVSIDGFSNGCFSAPAFALARTAVHEIGHNFGLYHIFSGCAAGADFAQVTPAGQTLPATLLAAADDTPSQSASTGGCPTGVVASNCAGVPNPPGKNYQNQMDYSNDPCLTMFTNGQVARMHYMLEFYRPGYLTTLGGVPPTPMPALDVAAVDVVSPGGSELVTTPTCSVVSYPTPACPGSFIPKLMVRNGGTTTLTSVTASVSINAGTPVTQTFTVNLTTDKTAVLSFPSQTLVSGSNAIVYTVSTPNGGADAVATNNTISKSVTIAAAGNAPLTEGFEGATFPPTNWTLAQASGTGNWARVTTAAKTGTASAKMDFYNFASGASSTLTSPPVNFLATNNIATLTFHYAHQSYTAAPGNEPDRLEVLVSTNCGTTWTSLWSRTGAALITATPANSTAAFTPTAAQWTQTPISVDLTPYKNQTVQLQFKATSGYGNNLYLDDINIFGTNLVANDAMISAINVPLPEFCGATFTPQVVVKNNGASPLTSVVVKYAVDPVSAPASYTTQTFTGLNIASTATTTLTLNAVTGVTNGNHTFKVYTDLPNGVTDQLASNDTLSKAFRANLPTTTFPIAEGFETAWTGTAAAPILANGWAVINPNANNTWTRSTLAAKTGTASVMIDNYNNNFPGQVDFLRSPLVNFTGKDSAYVTFQYAYKLYSTADTDTLDVVISTDCGNTWTSVWQKGGAQLATTTGTGGTAYTPVAADWQQVFINLDGYINSGALYIALRNKNDFGQRLFIDDINIVGKLLPDNDAEMVAMLQPGTEACTFTPTPVVRVKNAGKLAITALSIGYTVDGGAVNSKSFTGLNIPRGGTADLTLNATAAITAGNHTIKYFSFLPNNVADQNVSNDTLSKVVLIKNVVDGPLAEGFEGTNFPPTGWDTLQAPANATKWAKTTGLTASTGIAAAYMQNFNTTPVTANSIDNLITPPVKFAAADSAFLTFDVSYASRQFPGSTAILLDTLDVQVTTDCGLNWTSVYKKSGTDLQTISDVNNTYTYAYFPSAKSQWRTEKVNLTSFVAAGATVRANFKHTSNNGNNVFIDNVNIYNKTVAAKVKTNGYMVAPNPTNGTFVLYHYLPPTNLRGVGVYNAAGQRLMYMSYMGNADSYIPIDMSRFAAGIYTIKIEYTNKTITDRIIKL